MQTLCVINDTVVLLQPNCTNIIAKLSKLYKTAHISSQCHLVKRRLRRIFPSSDRRIACRFFFSSSDEPDMLALRTASYSLMPSLMTVARIVVTSLPFKHAGSRTSSLFLSLSPLFGFFTPAPAATTSPHRQICNRGQILWIPTIYLDKKITRKRSSLHTIFHPIATPRYAAHYLLQQ